MNILECIGVWVWSEIKLGIESLNVITVIDCISKLVGEAFQDADFDGVTL
jgi:hypothetical protein